MTNKVYADGKGPAYSYMADGKLASRVWARGVTTDYGFDALGQMTNIVYSDGTPGVSFSCDRLGRQATIVDGTGTRTFAYNAALQLVSEDVVAAVPGGTSNRIARVYDPLGRPAGFAVAAGADRGTTNYVVAYAYDPLGRFASVSSSVASASSVVHYSRVPGSDLIAGLTETNGGFSISRSYEAQRDLLTQVLNMAGTNAISQFDYANDALGRRVSRLDVGAGVPSPRTNDFGYNLRSELTEASMGTNRYGYCYDPIGNRQTASNNAEVLTYLANALNQYTNIADGVTNSPAYDADGNMTNCGAFAFSWDGENRLAGVSSNGQVVAGYAYDYMGRRYQKVVGGTTNIFLYDGWAMVRESNVQGLTSNPRNVS